MLPLHTSVGEAAERPSLATSRDLGEYVKMMFRYAQLDIDYTVVQMLYLCCSPRKVYQLTSYR